MLPAAHQVRCLDRKQLSLDVLRHHLRADIGPDRYTDDGLTDDVGPHRCADSCPHHDGAGHCGAGHCGSDLIFVRG